MPADQNPNAFADLGLSEPVLKALKKVGYEQPSPIQAASIPPLLEGKDMIGQAQTGTGKTAAFALPILSRLGKATGHPRALVLCPTRELAIQVAEAFQSYARAIKDFHVLPVYGGQDMRGQLRQLKRGVDVVVGTPGRLLDHLKRGSLDLSKLSAVVLDEADEMLRMGFIDDVEEILSHTEGDRQTALFSATMPPPIKRVADRFLDEPTHVQIEAKTATVERIDQRYWMLRNNQKLDALTRVLEFEDFDAAIIFVRTRGTTTELAEKLNARGYASAAINGDMSQSAREQTIRRLKKSQIDILVATDVAARGLDVERISHVINYDIPYDSEAYIHRIGRTGRAGRSGSAILFINNREQRLLRSIEKTTGQKIAKLQLPTFEEIQELRVQRFKESVIALVSQRPAPVYAKLISELCDETGATPQSVAAAMAELADSEGSLAAEPPPPESHKKKRTDKESAQRDDQRKKRGKDSDPDIELELFRIEVGKAHDVEPGQIVGAIANEVDLDSRYIGHIKLYDEYSTVELPSGMPKEIFNHLKKVRIQQQPLNISRAGKQARPEFKKPSKKKTGAKKKSGSPKKAAKADAKPVRKPRKRKAK